jgi:hypothetical protein
MITLFFSARKVIVAAVLLKRRICPRLQHSWFLFRISLGQLGAKACLNIAFPGSKTLHTDLDVSQRLTWENYAKLCH